MSVYIFLILNFSILYCKMLFSLCFLLHLRFNHKYIYSIAAMILLVISTAFLLQCSAPKILLDTVYIFITCGLVYIQISGERKKISFFIVYLFLTLLEILFAMISLSLIKFNYGNLLDNPFFSMINNLVGLCIVVSIYYVLIFRKKSGNSILKTSKISFIVVLLLSLIALTFSIAPVLVYSFSGFSQSGIVLYSICSSLMIFFILISYIWLLRTNNEKEYYLDMVKLSEEQMLLQLEYYRMLLNKDDETRKFRHDITNHLLCIRLLQRNEEHYEVGKYLDRLVGEMHDLQVRFNTGNNIVDVILDDIVEKNSYKNFEFKWKGVICDDSPLSNMDLCIIFSNLIKNAMEAIIKDDVSNCKYLHISVTDDEGQFKLVVMNSALINTEKIKSGFLTSKKDKKNHGFGLRNVKKCVDINNGLISFDYDSFCFKVTVIIKK